MLGHGIHGTQCISWQLVTLQSSNEEASSFFEPLLADFFSADKETLEDGTRLRRFVSTLEGAVVPIDGIFNDGVALIGTRLPASASVGGLLAVELHWEDAPGRQKLFLHLIAPDGSMATQRDTLPEATPDRHALLLPATLTADTYTLLAGRYDPESGQRVGLLQGGDTIVVGQIEVIK